MPAKKYSPFSVLFTYEDKRVELAFPDNLERDIRFGLGEIGIDLPPADRVLAGDGGSTAVYVSSFEADQPEAIGPELVKAVTKAGVYDQHQHVIAPSWGSTKIFLDTE